MAELPFLIAFKDYIYIAFFLRRATYKEITNTKIKTESLYTSVRSHGPLA